MRLVGLGGRHTAPFLHESPRKSTTRPRPSPRSGGPTGRARSSSWRPVRRAVRRLAGGDPDTAATTTAERIMFAPGAAADERCLVTNRVAPRAFPLRGARRHRRRRTALAHRGRRRLRRPAADTAARGCRRTVPGAVGLPTDAELNGPHRSLAYDRAWWFSRFVADAYGTAALRSLYLRACGHGHPDLAAAVRDTLGTDLAGVLTRWRQWGEQGAPAAMSRVLLVTNDFPPRRGGIQSYLENLVHLRCRRVAHADGVRAQVEGLRRVRPRRRLRGGATPGHLDAPRAVCRQADAATHRTSRHDTVWFGAAAPLALMAPLARDAGAGRVIASTHGHEVGWSMLPRPARRCAASDPGPTR